MQQKFERSSSPVERLKNAKPVDPDKVRALESRLKRSYVVGMSEYNREARLRAESIKDKVLY
jgi:hypothetical protein